MSIYEHSPDLAQELYLSGYDGKNIVDAQPADPEMSYEGLAELYHRSTAQPEFDLSQFVTRHLEIRGDCIGEGYIGARQLLPYANRLILANTFYNPQNSGTYIGLPHPSIQPCPGRFTSEQYGHDTGKVIEGLAVDTTPFEHGDDSGLNTEQRWNLIQGMVDNQVYLQRINGQYGHCIPTANRQYYLSRAQDSRFANNVRLLANRFEQLGTDPLSAEHPFIKYLPALDTEWKYWNGGRRHFSRRNGPGEIKEGTVLLDDAGTFGTCYQDRASGPRQEMWSQDVNALKEAWQDDPSIDADMFFHHWRIGAAQAWDYTEQRHFAVPGKPSTIQAAYIVYVDASSRQYELERTLAEAHQLRAAYHGRLRKPELEVHDLVLAERYRDRAARRLEMINTWHYDLDTGYYYDVDFRTGKRTPAVSTGGMYPLLVGAASPEQATGAIEFFRSELVVNGLVRVTNKRSAQQWDGLWWPGEHDAALGALERYGFDQLGYEIADRSLQVNQEILTVHGSLGENLNPEAPLGVGAEGDGDEGEYPRQQNFSWNATSVRYTMAARARFARRLEMTPDMLGAELQR